MKSSRSIARAIFGLAAGLALASSPAMAQQQQACGDPASNQAGASGQAATTTQASAPAGSGGQAQEPATPKGSGQENGSAPANAGNTGWTGGTGGSYVGTTPAGANPSSPTVQPEVARGLDPMKSTPRPKAAC